MMVPQDIAMISWACAQMNHRDSKLMELLGTKSIGLLERFRSHELAQTLLAMAELDLTHAGLFAATLKSIEIENEVGLLSLDIYFLAFLSSSPFHG